jgi:hypothetical protein
MYVFELQNTLEQNSQDTQSLSYVPHIKSKPFSKPTSACVHPLSKTTKMLLSASDRTQPTSEGTDRLLHT